jgi:GDP-D-mannose dehydratase
MREILLTENVTLPYIHSIIFLYINYPTSYEVDFDGVLILFAHEGKQQAKHFIHPKTFSAASLTFRHRASSI